MALLPNRGTKARWPVSKGRVCYMHELTKIAMACAMAGGKRADRDDPR